MRSLAMTGGRPSLSTGRAQCYGTRKPVVERWYPATGGTYARRYGRGVCAVCQKVVTCHKDGSAVAHEADE